MERINKVTLNECPRCGRPIAFEQRAVIGGTQCTRCGCNIFFCCVASRVTYFFETRSGQIPERVSAALATKLGVRVEDLQRRRLEDLAVALDSLDTVEIVMEIEESAETPPEP